MKAPVTDANGRHFTIDLSPICDRDFCDTCGDCLWCYGDYDCDAVEGQEHTWIVEHEMQPDRAAELSLIFDAMPK